MSLQPSPASLPIYNSINWGSLIVAPNNVTINSVTYDPQTNLINVDFSYSSSIESSQVHIKLNTTASPQLIAIPPLDVLIKA